VQRCVSRLLVLVFIILFIVLPARADEPAATTKRQPIGIVSSDDGEKIVVGIGTTKPLATLDVSRGEVKLGSTGAPCTKALSGTLRYVDTKLQLCDGAGWKNVSLDKAQ
jgi:hypothetical protein